MEINGCLLVEANDKGWFRHLSIFIHLKSIHPNSCIYNYSQDRLVEKTGLSKSTIRKYVNFFIKKEWCKVQNGHLIFRKLRMLTPKQKKLRYKIYSKKVEEITKELYLYLLKHKSEQAKWYSNLRFDLENGGKKVRGKLAQKLKNYPDFFKGTYYNGEKNVNRFKISFKKIAEWFNVSVGKAFKIIKELYVEGRLLIYSGGYTAVRRNKVMSKAIIQASKKSFMAKSGKMIIVHSNSYVFS